MPRRPRQEERKRPNGTGSVWELKNGRWRWEVVLGYINEKRITKSGMCANKTLAQKAAAQAITDHARGNLSAPDRVTIKEWLEQWLEGKRSRISTNTNARYSDIIRLHIVPHLGKKRVQALKPVDLRGFYANLTSKGMSPRTVRHVHGVLFGALKDALKLELVMRNVADVVRPEVPSQDNTVKASQAWTANEVTAFIEAARGDRLFPLFYLLILLGLRRGEACGLRWSNVDLEKRTVKIQEALVIIQGKIETSTPKTKKSVRVLRIPDDVVTVLKQHRTEQNAMHLEHEVTPEVDYVFTTAKGTPVYPDNLNRTLERIAGLASVRVIRIHDLRHTWASLARRAGVPLEIVSEKLGHARPSFTADVYRHTFEDEHEAGTLNLGDLLASRPRAVA